MQGHTQYSHSHGHDEAKKIINLGKWLQDPIPTMIPQTSNDTKKRKRVCTHFSSSKKEELKKPSKNPYVTK
jgi:hypothetical protein